MLTRDEDDTSDVNQPPPFELAMGLGLLMPLPQGEFKDGAVLEEDAFNDDEPVLENDEFNSEPVPENDDFNTEPAIEQDSFNNS